MRIRLLLALVCAAALPAASPAAVPPPLRVLFVGNSLTAANDLPGVVASLGGHGRREVVTRTVAFGGVNPEGHWDQGHAPAAPAGPPGGVGGPPPGPAAPAGGPGEPEEG